MKLTNLSVIKLDDMYIVGDDDAFGYFEGTEIECQRFIVEESMVIEKVRLIQYPYGVAYDITTNIGSTEVYQTQTPEGGKQCMFYTCDYGTIAGKTLREVLIETFAWDLSYSDYLKECAAMAIDANDPFSQSA